ncbi:hypothetical protein CRUP_037790 [Coryphaenoides rupestris]|nr:hypothetical protein CRUP_037790 [Coryphaenoides rupestris]
MESSSAAPTVHCHCRRPRPHHWLLDTDRSQDLKFTFSQPAAPSSTTSATTSSMAQPTTPSSFSFSAKVLQPQVTPLFGGAGGFSQTSAFGDPKAKPNPVADKRGGEWGAALETNVFARLGKGTKRKEDPEAQSGSSSKKPLKEEQTISSSSVVADTALRHPPKRALLRSADSAKTPEPEAESEQATHARHTLHSESSESSSGAAAPTDCVALQCKGVPPALNKKEVLEKHFARFGQVRNVLCRLAKSLAIVHFQDHVSATKAKKRGKVLHRHELHLFWQRKKQIRRLLEQRDKCTDLVLSKVFVGTCPDMCPEKERYMRETRKQLSCFELVPDTEMVDHRAAIKEYSRSSADQEVPLPHELRPLPVLSMTVDYLITQTVALIEKCTCLHVHCAHHLCEESMMTFDAKINNENMTKCLQSLKEMYEDLASCQVYCPPRG